MPTFDDVRRLAAGLPEVAEAPSYHGMPALKVQGKPFCRFWSEREHDRDGVRGSEVIVVFCDEDEKELLLESSAGEVFTTPHYDGYAALLIRLADVDLATLSDLLEDSYRSRAPRSLLKGLEDAGGE